MLISESAGDTAGEKDVARKKKKEKKGSAKRENYSEERLVFDKAPFRF